MKYIAIFLVLLCCLMGAASAADDVSTDLADSMDSVDDVAVDAVQEEIDDSSTIDVTTEPTVSDDTTIEEIDEGNMGVESSEDYVSIDSGQTRATNVNVKSWYYLYYYSQKTNDYNIHLKSAITCGSQIIDFKNNVNIIGTPSNYITGNFSGIPFISTGSLNISFINVTFKDMSADVLIKLATTGTNNFINCSFNNITTTLYKSSVIWNENGTMNINGCNFTNCVNGFGAITNFADLTNGYAQMNVENSRFENNFARREPGAINNCGDMNITNCTFVHNIATWWAGAVHTHTGAYTRIVGSNFTDNMAGGTSGSGWNGGALFSYSKLEVINSTFTDNKCNVSTGGGAIFGYSMGSSIYNITVDSCNFTGNRNNYSTTATKGKGGAIGVQNIGYLTVINSTFINNSADNGSAIAAICENVSYCNNCTNCNCTGCPNCSNCSHNVSTGDPSCDIHNNTFINHTGPGDTIMISGNNYVFYNNPLINSVQTVDYNESESRCNLPDGTSLLYNQIKHNSILGNSVLGDFEPHDIIYVNESSENIPDDDDIHGSSWDDAFGTEMGFSLASELINDGGTIYLADVTFSDFFASNGKNYTVIGLDREKTIANSEDINFGGSSKVHNVITFINITFQIPQLRIENDVVFINCTFINSNMRVAQNTYNMYVGAPENVADFTDSFNANFTNCNFVNCAIDGYRFSQINFNNCSFEEITTDSIVKNIGGFGLQDAINFYDCNFTNVNVKGIVDVPTGTNPVERYRIEGCSGVPTVGVVTEDGRDFVNTTQSRAETVLVTDIDSEGNLLINLTDKDGNAMAEYDVLISVNGAEATPYTLGTDGTLSIALTDLTDATGKLNIAVSFEEDDDYKGSSDSISTVLVVNTVTEVINNTIVEYVNKTLESTSIVANALTATAKVAKTLSVTLKDASGKAIANKVITYSINGVTKTVKTDANGIAKITVNQAKAGAYYYSLCFLGDDDYKSAFKSVKVTVNKQATKAVFKAKTFKVKAKTKKVSFTLKDASGKAIKGKKITVKVNGKTYTATTNAKGVATFKVKLTKKGKYTATAKFAGDTSYKAITKKAKITIK